MGDLMQSVSDIKVNLGDHNEVKVINQLL